MDTSSVKALTIDVFGTVVDSRSAVVREGTQLGKAQGIEVDWAQFADAWQARSVIGMDRVRRGEIGWANLDPLHRMALDELLSEFKITGLNEAEKDHLNRVWHRLTPWPDAIPGLERLRERYVVSALSNGNMALLVNMAKHAGLPWDCILSAELVQHYKPDPEVYQMAADLLGLRTDQVMMVAAHKGDLLAAQAVGLRTAFVLRPIELGFQNTADLSPHSSFDVVANDFNGLAEKLGV